MVEERQGTIRLVICGSYKEFLQYLRENGLNRNQALYITYEDQLRGWKDYEIVRYGKWEKSPVANSDTLRIVESRLYQGREQ